MIVKPIPNGLWRNQSPWKKQAVFTSRYFILVS